MKRIAVVGAGVSGLVAAYTLLKAGNHEVVLYEKEDYFGGHARTENVNGVAVDLGFMVFNQVTYPNMVSLFDELGVDIETSDMSFSVSLDGGKGCEWGSKGLAAVFAQKSNLFNPYFLRMIREIVKFQSDVLNYLNKLEQEDESVDVNQTLGSFLESHGYSEKFRDCYLIPVCASIWSCSSEQVLGFSAASILTFCRNHHLLQIFGRPQWLTVKDRSEKYVQKIIAELTTMGCELRLGCAVSKISSTRGGVEVEVMNGEKTLYDKCLIAAHAPDALSLLGDTATFDERRILGAFRYSYSDIYLHRDREFMPKSAAAWSAWNFLGTIQGRVCVTYWLNLLQNLGNTGEPFLVTLNPVKPPKIFISKWRTGHPVPSPGTVSAVKQLDTIQGVRQIWFAGAYQGYGFHEDGFKAGMAAANSLLGANHQVLPNVKQMSFTLCQYQARREVMKFLHKYIVFGSIQFLEAGGTVLDIVGKDCGLKTKLRIHRPEFYWKIATRSDLGLAEAYMDEDFTCIDSQNGLLNFFLIIIKNRDWMLRSIEKGKKRGWWTPPMLTAALSSALVYVKHKLRNNSLPNARKNISEHYDLSNEMFSLFLDETMTYSCAIFKGPEEPLKDAQLRKMHHLIDKARIESSHEVLEIGFGWGSLALEVVRRTGCNYTGISLSEEQLRLAKQLVKQSSLEDKITLKLCDYRSLDGYKKYNRIISWYEHISEMLEAVGHEYYDDFFAKCDYLLAEDGLAVIQVITVPEERYDELRKSSEFIKEYIFPGGSLPCLAALTAAMFRSSSFCIEHLENIGLHYYQTLMCWRRNFHSKQSDLVNLGFRENFIRKWDYYFVYCAAGFKTCTLGNLQIVFSRSGNTRALGNPYRAFPSA